MMETIISAIHKDKARGIQTRWIVKWGLFSSDQYIIEVMVEDEAKRLVVGRADLSPNRPHEGWNRCVRDIPFALR